jgi:hypothetical protein
LAAPPGGALDEVPTSRNRLRDAAERLDWTGNHEEIRDRSS